MKREKLDFSEIKT